MWSLLALFVALIMNRVTTPFQQIFDTQTTASEQRKEMLSKGLQLLGMLVVAIYGVSGQVEIAGISGRLIVQVVLGIALGLALGQCLELFSFAHVRPPIEGKKPTSVYDRWIWDTIFISIFVAAYVKYNYEMIYMIAGWAIYVIVPYGITRYLESRNANFYVHMKSYKIGTVLWIIAAAIHAYAIGW